ncbi:MAG: type II toxin-antitoxin system YafQ family toxin [Thermodesulfobacteriota bacterium]
MRKFKTTRQFDRDFKRMIRSGKEKDKLIEIMQKLIAEQPLDAKHRDHKLRGRFEARRECHIEPNWLLIYKLEDDCVIFERTGSHSDLFR